MWTIISFAVLIPTGAIILGAWWAFFRPRSMSLDEQRKLFDDLE